MIKKQELANGEYYLGVSRRTQIAQWYNGKFIYIDKNFGIPYIESIDHYDDVKNGNSDGFIPNEQIVVDFNQSRQIKIDNDYNNYARNFYKNLNSKTLNGEEWLIINGYPNYSASSYGRIKRNDTNKIAHQSFNQSYLVLALTDNKGKRKNFRVHRLVAFTFKKNEWSPTLEVNHINGIKTDNRAVNLECVTRKENSQHMFSSGNIVRKLTPSIVMEIKRDLASGKYLQKELAKKYSICESVMSDIRRGKKWGSIKITS